MNAWLITWEWNQNHARKDNPFIAIFSCRKREKFVSEFVEQIYCKETLTVEEKVYWLNRSKGRPHNAVKQMMINDVPHSDRIICGDHPYIYARMVSDFKVIPDSDNNIERLSWKEPSTFKWKNKEELETELAEEGIPKTLDVKMR